MKEKGYWHNFFNRRFFYRNTALKQIRNGVGYKNQFFYSGEKNRDESTNADTTSG